KWSLAHNLILMKVEVQDKNQRLVSQLIPIVYENPENNLPPLAEQVIGLDVNQLIPAQINNTIFAYFPETPPQLVIGELVIPPQDFYSEKKIYIYKIANELQLAAGIHQGEMVIKDSTSDQNFFKFELIHDTQTPQVELLWPQPYYYYKKQFTLYGKTFDDSNSIKFSYLLDSDLPQQFNHADFQNKLMKKVATKAEKQLLSEIFQEEAGMYKRKKSLSHLQLLQLLNIFQKLNIPLPYKTFVNDQVIEPNQILVPFLAPLSRDQTRTLASYLDDNNLIINENEKVFALPIPELDEGSHFVQLKVEDGAGKINVTTFCYKIDTSQPELAIMPYFTPIKTQKEEISSRKTKRKKNQRPNVQEKAEEKPEEWIDQMDLESINGEMLVRGVATDNGELAQIKMIYNEEEVDVAGIDIWDYLYNFNGIQNFDQSDDSYVVQVKAYDQAGNQIVLEKEYHIDRVRDKPQTLIHNPILDNQRFSNDFKIYGIALDDDGVDHVLYRITHTQNEDQDGETPLEEIEWKRLEIEAGSGKWSENIFTDQLVSGKHLLEVQSEDIYGVKSDIVKMTFHLDINNPVVQVTSPENGTYLKDKVTISGTAFDQNDIDIVEISSNYGSTYVSTTGLEDWNYQLDTKSLPDGPLNILVKAKDKSGSEGYTFSLFNIDNTPPAIEIIEPRDGDLVNNVMLITGRASDNIELKEIKLRITRDDQNMFSETDEEGFIIATGKETWKYEVDTSAWETNQVYHLVVRAMDVSGNNTDKTLDFIVDPLSDLPVVEINQPQQNQHLTGEFINIYGTAYDDEGIEGVFLRLDNAEEEIKLKGTEIWKYILPTENLSRGKHSLEIYAVEKSVDGQPGKKSSIVQRDFYLDNSGPVITVDSHINGLPVARRPVISGSVFYYEKNLELKIKQILQEEKHLQLKKKYYKTPEKILEPADIPIKKGELLRRMKKYQIKKSIKNLFVSADNGKNFKKCIRNGNNWKIKIETPEMDDGSYLLQFKGITKTNQVKITYFNILIDRNVPTTQILTPNENQKFNDKIVVKGIADDNEQVDSVKISLNQYDKKLRKMPKFVQGIYLWLQAFGGFWVSGGFGLTFFDDIVRLEALFGWTATPENLRDLGVDPDSINRGFLNTSSDSVRYDPRYAGFATGGKLLARILDLPFEFFWGEDARNFSVSLEIGCGFYWFSGFGGAARERDGTYYEENRSIDSEYSGLGYAPVDNGTLIAALMYQIDFFKVERFGPFRKFALYFEHSFFFIASEIKGGIIQQIGFGLRNAIF
ncbi:MAG: Ig-like domain-containing protein, partial [Spirochaetes bacterium]|nr:Ig-like domain-containing protein [Spirochaetota bacterium]